MIQNDFCGKVALVTGGARGLGLAAAQHLASRGARVVISDLAPDQAAAAASRIGPEHVGIGGDVTDEGDAEAMVAAACALGRLDVLVNSAGIADSAGPIINQPAAHFRRMLDVHVTGTFLMSQKAAVPMLRQGAGAIVNIASIAGLVGSPGRPAYSTAKAGVIMLTRILALEWAPHRVRVNAVAPGYVMTELVRGLVDSGELDVSLLLRRTPMGEFGEPVDVAQAIAFLAGDAAHYVTGVTLPVDGGYAAFGGAGAGHDPSRARI